MTKTANKGEWSEIYVLFKLLGEKQVYAGDGNLNKIENLFYPILKILRDEKKGHYEYTLEDDIVVVTEDGIELLRKKVSDFLDKANMLLNIIRQSNGAFVAPEIEQFMSEIHCSNIKAKSQEKQTLELLSMICGQECLPCLDSALNRNSVAIPRFSMLEKPPISRLW